MANDYVLEFHGGSERSRKLAPAELQAHGCPIVTAPLKQPLIHEAYGAAGVANTPPVDIFTLLVLQSRLAAEGSNLGRVCVFGASLGSWWALTFAQMIGPQLTAIAIADLPMFEDGLPGLPVNVGTGETTNTPEWGLRGHVGASELPEPPGIISRIKINYFQTLGNSFIIPIKNPFRGRVWFSDSVSKGEVHGRINSPNDSWDNHRISFKAFPPDHSGNVDDPNNDDDVHTNCDRQAAILAGAVFSGILAGP